MSEPMDLIEADKPLEYFETIKNQRRFNAAIAEIRRLRAECERKDEALNEVVRVPDVAKRRGHFRECAWCNGSANIARAALKEPS